ncbi:MAG: hypothetical protein Q7R96_01490 [Nanoarchaeota archaeon]|nr:hypothetical protein [Nanoarchaeota archaeon]
MGLIKRIDTYDAALRKQQEGDAFQWTGPCILGGVLLTFGAVMYYFTDYHDSVLAEKRRQNVLVEQKKLLQQVSDFYHQGKMPANWHEVVDRISNNYTSVAEVDDSLEARLGLVHAKWFSDRPVPEVMADLYRVVDDLHVDVSGRDNQAYVFLGFLFHCCRTQTFDGYRYGLMPDLGAQLKKADNPYDGATLGDTLFFAVHLSEEMQLVVKGKAYLFRGDKEDAKAAFKDVLKLNPNNLEAKTALDVLLPLSDKWSREELRFFSLPEYCW